MSSTDTLDTPLAEQAYRQLRQAIVRCEFEPGQRLRVDELSRRYEVSSSPVREALSRLSEQGLVRAFENRGFRVAPLTVQGVADLTRVRTLVECESLREAMAVGDDAWEAGIVAAAHALGRTEERLSGLAPALDNEWTERHRAYHLALHGACRSPLLQGILVELFDSAERYRRYSAAHRSFVRNKHAEHERLKDAVLARDTERALDLLRRHISGTQRGVTEALQRLQRTQPA